MKKFNCLYYFIVVVLLLSCKDESPVEQLSPLVVSDTVLTLSPAKPYAEIVITKGAGDYKVSVSDEIVAQYVLLENKLYITGYKIGNSIVILRDKDNNQVKIKVTINELIPRVYPMSNLVYIKVGDSKFIKNTDPNPLYFLKDTGSLIQAGGTANNVQITAKKKGNAYLYYLKEYWPTTEYNIQAIDHYLFTVSPATNTLRLAVGAESEYYILSGCGEYSLTNSNIISAELVAWPVEPTLSHSNPRIVRIKGLQKGTSELKITNVETSEVKTVNVTVS